MTWRRQSLRRDETYQYYSPRPNPTPIPAERWDEGEMRCLQVNHTWVAHILGVMEALDQPDTWQGTPEEIEDARAQVNEIMLALGDCEMANIRYGEETKVIEIKPEGADWQIAPLFTETKRIAAWGMAKAQWFEDFRTVYYSIRTGLESGFPKATVIAGQVSEKTPYDATEYESALSDLWDYAEPDPSGILWYADFSNSVPPEIWRVASEFYYCMLASATNPGVMQPDQWSAFRFRKLIEQWGTERDEIMLRLIAANEEANNYGRNRSRFAYPDDGGDFENFARFQCHTFDWTAGNVDWTLTTGTQDASGLHSVVGDDGQTIDISLSFDEARMFDIEVTYQKASTGRIYIQLDAGGGGSSFYATSEFDADTKVTIQPSPQYPKLTDSWRLLFTCADPFTLKTIKLNWFLNDDTGLENECE